MTTTDPFANIMAEVEEAFATGFTAAPQPDSTGEIAQLRARIEALVAAIDAELASDSELPDSAPDHPSCRCAPMPPTAEPAITTPPPAIAPMPPIAEPATATPPPAVAPMPSDPRIESYTDDSYMTWGQCTAGRVVPMTSRAYDITSEKVALTAIASGLTYVIVKLIAELIRLW